MTPYADTAEQIKRARERLGYTQKELALLCGVSQSNISKVEKGIRKRIDYQSLSAIAKALKIQLR